MSYKIVGITDEITTCDQCGKINLKKTIALEDETGIIVHFGSDCAAVALGWSNYKGDGKERKRVDQRATAVQMVSDNLARGVAPDEICKQVRLQTYFNSWYSGGKIIIIFQEDYGDRKKKREFVEIEAAR